MWRSLWAPWSEFSSVALDWRLLLFTKPSDFGMETGRPSTQAVLGSFRRHCQFIYSHADGIDVTEAVIVEILRHLGLKPPPADCFTSY
ncbi:hypothetical protein PHMEG_0003549 [Phytophthora megakarya]|uniref:Uncharacterized protein n=1 Tax=Phytophthora megakarya TaxID=4795 RepID=A0A225WW24_9STRA|nr:hypothetical protein PHMEG_0003549 [Phytophthora megakarya]